MVKCYSICRVFMNPTLYFSSHGGLKLWLGLAYNWGSSPSGVARAFLGRRLTHPEDQNEEDIEKNEEKWKELNEFEERLRNSLILPTQDRKLAMTPEFSLHPLFPESHINSISGYYYLKQTILQNVTWVQINIWLKFSQLVSSHLNLKAYSLISYWGRSQKFQNWNLLHLFVAFLRKIHFPKGI